MGTKRALFHKLPYRGATQSQCVLLNMISLLWWVTNVSLDQIKSSGESSTIFSELNN